MPRVAADFPSSSTASRVVRTPSSMRRKRLAEQFVHRRAFAKLAQAVGKILAQLDEVALEALLRPALNALLGRAHQHRCDRSREDARGLAGVRAVKARMKTFTASLLAAKIPPMKIVTSANVADRLMTASAS